jgi:IS30 family transposase
MGTVAEGRARKRPKAYKIDRKKVLELKAKGMNDSEIARNQGVAQSTIGRFLLSVSKEAEHVEAFKAGRADILASLQAKSLDLQQRIVDSLTDGDLALLSPAQKGGMLTSLNIMHGTLYDKERLERGQSTANVSLIAKMMGSALKDAGKSPAPSEGVGQSEGTEPTSRENAPATSKDSP